MKIFVAGGTGAIGRRLVPLLLADGHEVTVSTRSPSRFPAIRAQGANPVVLDGLNNESARQAIIEARPDAVIHQMTAIPTNLNLRKFDAEFAVTNRLRSEGTEHLIAASREAGSQIFIAQSYTGWPNERSGGRVKTEEDPLDSNPPASMRQSLAAIRTLESSVSNAGPITGIVLRYANFYGPGTSIGKGGPILDLLRRRRLPIVGEGSGVWSFLHIDDAARATQAAIQNAKPGIYNIADDEPAEVREWLPYLADAIDARKPFRLPAWLGHLAIGEAGMSMMEQIRGSSNTKAKRELGWIPIYSSWREGFRTGL